MHAGAQLANGALTAAAGLALWTFTEYAAHRWVMHNREATATLPIDPAAPHMAHHRRPRETSAAARLSAMGGIAAVAMGAHRVGAPTALAATWAAGYVTYDITHWFAHHRPARTNWGEQLRARHLRHHLGAPNANFGVTVDWWDQLFGTVAEPPAVSRPIR